MAGKTFRNHGSKFRKICSHSNFVPWLLTHFAGNNIDINDSNLDSENISRATCWTDEFQTVNKPKPSYRFHRWCPSCRFNRRYKSFFWLEGFWIKTFFEIKRKIKVNNSPMLSRMYPLLNLLCKTWLSFLSDNVKITIRKAVPSSKSTTMISYITWQVLALSSLHLHMVWIIEHSCVEVKACGENTRLELCCHHSGWGIVLQAYAAQMGKWCDPLESGLSTFMYSSEFCLISSDTMMWNIYGGEHLPDKIHQTSQVI